MFTIIGRRWFDRANGNTYHSVEVYKDGELIGKVPFTYGYGSHYQQTAFDIVRQLGYYSNERYPSGGYKDYTKFTHSKPYGDGNLFIVSDVRRKKDL